MIELYEGEYKYILNCINELLPIHYSEMVNSLKVVKNEFATNERNAYVYIFELTITKKEYLSLINFERKLKKGQTKEDYENLDEYCDFFFFLKDNFHY